MTSDKEALEEIKIKIRHLYLKLFELQRNTQPWTNDKVRNDIKEIKGELSNITNLHNQKIKPIPIYENNGLNTKLSSFLDKYNGVMEDYEKIIKNTENMELIKTKEDTPSYLATRNSHIIKDELENDKDEDIKIIKELFNDNENL